MEKSSAVQISKKPPYEMLSRLLLDEYVLVHIKPQEPGVSVPPRFEKQDSLTLKLSKLFRGTLDLTKERVSAELLFDNSYFTCVIPLEAIWGTTSHAGLTYIWPERAPAGVTKGVASTATTTDDSPAPTAQAGAGRRKGHLTRVK